MLEVIVHCSLPCFPAVLSVSNNSSKDNDSGLGASSSDVIVFGTEIEFSDLSTSKSTNTLIMLLFVVVTFHLKIFSGVYILRALFAKPPNLTPEWHQM